MQRIQSLDLARGFTVLFIPAIHTVMLYSKPEVYTSWLGYPLQFIAEGPGGQLFMLLMGIVFTFKKTHSLRHVLIKSLLLLLAGYLLNILKFVLLYQMGWLPVGVQYALRLQDGGQAVWQLLFLGDILHFAAIALLVIYAVYQLKNYHIWAIAGSIGIILISPVVWDAHSSKAVFDYVLQLFTGKTPQVFFPVFPWLAYPLLGLAVGYWMKQYKERVYELLLKLGILCFLTGIACRLLIGDTDTSFYRTYPWDTIWHIGIVLQTICIWQWAAKRYSPNRFFELLTFCSQNITQIYIIQWVLICWLLPVIGYQQLAVWASLGIACLTTIITYGIAASINLLQEFGKRR